MIEFIHAHPSENPDNHSLGPLTPTLSPKSIAGKRIPRAKVSRAIILGERGLFLLLLIFNLVPTLCVGTHCKRRSASKASRFLLSLIATFVLVSTIHAAEPQGDSQDNPIREIFVPFDDLQVVLEGGTRRVYLTRREYDKLVAEAEKTPPREAPQAAVVVAANYSVSVESDRAAIVGTLQIEVLRDGLHAVELGLPGVGLRRATLDDKPASLGRNDAGRTVLFAQGRGRHRLMLELSAPLATEAARQSLDLELPTPAATEMRLTVPGDVEIKSGATAIARRYDADAQVTTFDLLPPRGRATLVMSLNNRQRQTDRVVAARSVIVDELTQSYQRLHVTATLEVLHGAADQFRFALPEGFDVLEVSAPEIARWQIEEGDPRTLTAILREPASETVVLHILLEQAAPYSDDWALPRLRPLDVAGEAAVVGLLLDNRLKVDTLTPENLIAIDNDILAATLPATVTAPDARATSIRAVAAYYAPTGDFELAARFAKPDARVRATTNLLLVLSDTRQEVRGGFALLPLAEEIFGCEILAPAGWDVVELTYGEGQPLVYERYAGEDGGQRIVVRLPEGVPPGQVYSIHFRAVRTPPGWLDAWESRELTFPVFRVADTERDVGVIAVQGRDDMRVSPERLTRLVPLDENKKAEFGLGGVPTDLVYRYQSPPYEAVLRVERTQPRLTAETYSFLGVGPEQLTAHYEVIYQVNRARTRRLVLRLPARTPAEVAIRGLDGLRLKETRSRVEGDERIWTAELAEAKRGTLRLAVDFVQPTEAETQDLALPLVRAGDVAYQSGVVAVEGNAELDVELLEGHPRKVDVGELVAAEYQPGRRLLGAFGYAGDDAAVRVRVARHPGYGLPPAIVERAELATLVSTSGLSQTAARYRLRTKALLVEVELPAGSELWSAYLDGLPAKPQREGERLLVSLPADTAAAARDLQIVYEMPIDRMNLWGGLDVPAPALFLRADKSAQREPLPTADLAWRLYLPSDYQVTDSSGTVFTRQLLGRGQPLAWLRTDRSPIAWLVVDQSKAFARLSPIQGQAAREAGRRYAGGDKRAPTTSPDESGPLVDYESAGTEGEEGSTEAPFADAEPAPAPPPTSESTDDLFGVPADDALAKPAGPTAKPSPPQPSNLPLDGQAATAAHGQQDWALQGLRSLRIDLEATGEPVRFQSLGVEPRLAVRVVDRERMDRFAWGAALAILLVGVAMTGHGAAAKIKLVVGVLAVAVLIPLLTGWGAALGDTLDKAMAAVLLLVVYYVVIALALKTYQGIRTWRDRRRAKQTAVAAAAMVLCIAASLADPRWILAQDAAKPAESYVVQIVPPPTPVSVPDDAVIIPYDPDGKGPADDAKLLVPYDRYAELWNRAYPAQKLDAQPVPAPYGLAGAEFTATLGSGDDLLFTGHLDVDVYEAGTVTVPLGLAGGVLARAEIGGQPARLQVIAPSPPQPNAPPGQGESNAPPQMQQQAAQTQDARLEKLPHGPLVVLYLTGKGRHRLDLAVRYPLTRSGGWRIAQGRLPAAPATSLTVTAAQPNTEVRLDGMPGRDRFESEAAGDSFDTALSTGGAFHLQWRSKIAEAVVDRSLTAQSAALLSVQEDGLHLAWDLDLSFRRGQRGAFTISVPADYLVERVTGENVRGWQLDKSGDASQIEVTLLEAAREHEKLSLVLSRRGRAGRDELAEFDVPVVAVADAMLHHGTIEIHRSPLVDLKTTETTGVTRTNLGEIGVGAQVLESPLGTRSFQAYRFVATPFRIGLAASPIEARRTAQVETLLRIAQLERTLETRVILRPGGRPMHAARLVIPEDLEVTEVTAPGQFEWSLVAEDDRRVLHVYLAAGQEQPFSVVLRGTLGEYGPLESIGLPGFEVLDVSPQQGQIVVQADPGLRAQAVDLENARTVLLEQTFSWLGQGQRRLARLAIAYSGADYSGRIAIEPRTPVVALLAVTNVTVTDRAFEETILLEYNVTEAGVRELEFILPASLRDARISVPMLRQKSVEPVGDDGGEVRIRLALEDEVMGSIRVLVENDRLVSSEKYSLPIPRFEGVKNARRYVTLESAGRDEVIIDKAEGIEPLSRQQKEWTTLAGILGGSMQEERAGRITQAYLVDPGAASPALVIHTKDRAAVETAGARIGLAETLLIVDSGGAYRAEQTYHVDNTTEQFLEIQLPDGAALWTAQVAGEPVKPTEIPGAAAGRVRVPLVKTAAGDRDFAVVLKYAGKMPELGLVESVAFPLVRTVNINVERSQVRLRLPDTHRWFGFGGSMRRVEEEGDLLAGFIAYNKQKIQELAEVAENAANPYASLRAKSNLKQLGTELDSFSRHGRYADENEELQQLHRSSQEAIQQAEQSVAEQERHREEAQLLGNRAQLNSRFESQTTERAKNIVNDLDRNFFQSQSESDGEGEITKGKAWQQRFGGRRDEFKPGDTPSEKPEGGSKDDDRRRLKELKEQKKAISQQQPLQQDQPQAPGVEKLRGAKTPQPSQPQSREPVQQLDRLRKYEQRLEDQTEQSGQAGAYRQRSSGKRAPGSGDLGVDMEQLERDTIKTQRAIRGDSWSEDPFGTSGVIDGIAGSPVGGGESGPIRPTGLASLDVELPNRGVEYLFTTPRGEIEITARAIERPLTIRLGRLLGLAIMVGAAFLLYRHVQRRGFDDVFGIKVSLALLLLGLISIVFRILPLVGLAAMIFGVFQILRLATLRFMAHRAK